MHQKEWDGCRDREENTPRHTPWRSKHPGGVSETWQQTPWTVWVWKWMNGAIFLAYDGALGIIGKVIKQIQIYLHPVFQDILSFITTELTSTIISYKLFLNLFLKHFTMVSTQPPDTFRCFCSNYRSSISTRRMECCLLTFRSGRIGLWPDMNISLCLNKTIYFFVDIKKFENIRFVDLLISI